MTVESGVLVFERLGPIARIMLNRPRAMNALNTEMVQALDDALQSIAADPESRVLVLTGAGSAFCAGADLKEALGDESTLTEAVFLRRASEVMERLRNLPKPVIAVLNGVTMAGGLELAMCADLILAADNAQIADAHANYGMFPGAGGAAILPRLLPLPTALYMLYTGKSISAGRLYELGFLSEIHPADRVAQAALDLANRIASGSPSALRRMKAVARASTDMSRADALAHEQLMLHEHLGSDDIREGLRAFSEKRTPRFTGR